jgi:hypothetical protein
MLGASLPEVAKKDYFERKRSLLIDSSSHVKPPIPSREEGSAADITVCT